MYAYPSTLSDKVLDAIASEEKVVKYVDIPLQHASEPVLKRMKRPTGKGNLLGMVERIRERVPGVAIRTSFIVGFPGETDERLRASCSASWRRAASTTSASSRSPTRRARRSFELPDRVPEARQGVPPPQADVAPEEAVAAPQPRARGRARRGAGRGHSPRQRPAARAAASPTQAPEIDGQVIVNDGSAEPGSFVTCEITEAHPYDLVARIV